MGVRIISVIVACLLFGYIVFSAVFLDDAKQDNVCNDLIVLVKDSLDKHFVTNGDLLSQLKQAKLNPVGQPMSSVNTHKIETELLKNEMIASVEAYKTPSGIIKLEVKQKMPILRVISTGGNFYVDNKGHTMPISHRYVAHVPVATGYVEKELATNELFDFALFLHENNFWNNQIEQIHVYPNRDVVLIPRVGDHRIMLGTFDDFEGKLDNLQLFYEQAIPKVGWGKYSIINLKFKNQIVCTKK
ncbi:MAG: cell division protein FtsQ [Tannerellaceae bacterium]|nr:cell division protein FtsQ [Tannerellaceae bacterium]